MNTATAIIPAFNEAHTIAEVVRVVCAAEGIEEVIVVDDGSQDDTADRAREAGARVIRSETNQGKGQAMARGVEASSTPYLLFFDADDRGLTTDHVAALLEPVRSGKLAMCVGLRDRGQWMMRVSAWLPLISGERAMLREVFTHTKPRFLRGFMVESALNYRCRVDGRQYGSVPLFGLTIRRKYEKVGWLRAIPQYVRMAARVAYATVLVRVAHAAGNF